MNLLTELQNIRKLIIIALFSDDYFLDIFVLKGGNVLDLAYKLNSRASIDIDVSMESDFTEDELIEVKIKLENVLSQTFREHKYVIFDFKFLNRPIKITPDKASFWGGYRVEFKLIKEDKYKELGKDLDKIRKHAQVIGTNQEKVFSIDISKFEYCKNKKEYELDNYTIYIYTPLMIVYEKLRAICQQMDEYIDIVQTNQKPRAKDFFDIHTLLEDQITMDEFLNKNNFKILEQMFSIKKVPLRLLELIEKYREFHRDSFNAVKESVYGSFKIKDYDYYYDYVLERAKLLESSWKE